MTTGALTALRRGRPRGASSVTQKISKAEMRIMADTANEKNVCVEVEIAGRITRVMPASSLSGSRGRVVIPEEEIRL